MSETIDNVSERLTRLEVTVAQGFHDGAARDAALGRRIDALSRKVDATSDALSRKIDANTESIRHEMREFREEMRRANKSIRLVLVDHERRLTDWKTNKATTQARTRDE